MTNLVKKSSDNIIKTHDWISLCFHRASVSKSKSFNDIIHPNISLKRVETQKITFFLTQRVLKSVMDIEDRKISTTRSHSSTEMKRSALSLPAEIISCGSDLYSKINAFCLIINQQAVH